MTYAAFIAAAEAAAAIRTYAASEADFLAAQAAYNSNPTLETNASYDAAADVAQAAELKMRAAMRVASDLWDRTQPVESRMTITRLAYLAREEREANGFAHYAEDKPALPRII